jgi:polar amino acid transport system permease protein
MLLALWPQGWSRQQRSNATLIAALVLMVLALSLLGHVLSFLPEPIGPNAQAFSEGARTTLWLTLVSGTVGLVLGTAAALARTSRWAVLRWVAGIYIWAIRGTPLLVQILFVYFALPVLVPGLNQRGQPHPVGHLPAHRHAHDRGRYLPAADHAGDADLQRRRVPL